METIQFHKAQSQIAQDKHRFRVVNCGRRFGKTLLSVWEMFGFAISKQNGKVAYLAPTYGQARDIAWSELKRVCLPIIVDVNESRLEIKIKNKFGGESMIVLRGWESVETLRGQAFDFLVLDEVSSYRNFWLNWQEVLRPTLTDRVGHGLFISTPKGFNHFYDLFNLESEDKDFKSFHFTSYDNPHLPIEELNKAKEQLTEDRFAQEYMADFRKTEGLVFKEFMREKHVIKGEIDENDWDFIKLFAGVDFGFVHPAAVMSIQKTSSGKYLVSSEWYRTGYTDAQISDYTAGLRLNECFPDPESAGGIEELKRRGVNIRDVVKGKDSVRNGINVIRELFKSNRLFIHESCKNLIWELETYSYDDPSPNPRKDENPKKENDHAIDAIRYALSMESLVREGPRVSQSTPRSIYHR